MKLLMKDLELLEQLSDVVYFGLFRVDIKEFKTQISEKIKKIIEGAFIHSLHGKFVALLETNERLTQGIQYKLQQSIVTIEEYVSLKKYTQSDELDDHLRAIKKDTELCRKIHRLESDFQINHEDVFERYLASLGWSSQLAEYRQLAVKKLVKSGPKFSEEMKRVSDEVLKEFEKIRSEMHKFHMNYDLDNAFMYYERTIQINEELAGLKERGTQVNSMQKILDMKPTNFDQMESEAKNFQKYSKLWDFIAAQWTTVRWCEVERGAMAAEPVLRAGQEGDVFSDKLRDGAVEAAVRGVRGAPADPGDNPAEAGGGGQAPGHLPPRGDPEGRGVQGAALGDAVRAHARVGEGLPGHPARQDRPQEDHPQRPPRVPPHVPLQHAQADPRGTAPLPRKPAQRP